MYQQTALHFAASVDSAEIIAMLKDKGADVNAADLEHHTALAVAAHFACLQAVRALLLLGADPEHEHPMTGLSALHYATLAGHPRAVELLAHSKLDPNVSDSRNWTALHWGAYHGDMPVVLSLLSIRCDPRYVDANGQRPSQIARDRDHVEVAEVLETHVARLDAAIIQPVEMEEPDDFPDVYVVPPQYVDEPDDIEVQLAPLPEYAMPPEYEDEKPIVPAAAAAPPVAAVAAPAPAPAIVALPNYDMPPAFVAEADDNPEPELPGYALPPAFVAEADDDEPIEQPTYDLASPKAAVDDQDTYAQPQDALNEWAALEAAAGPMYHLAAPSPGKTPIMEQEEEGICDVAVDAIPVAAPREEEVVYESKPAVAAAQRRRERARRHVRDTVAQLRRGD